MSSLLKRTSLWVIAFILATITGAIIFSVVERPNAENESRRKKELLDSLKREMEDKYNMTQMDFDNFTKLSCEALSSGPSWDNVDALRFAFETLTTIGYGALSPSTKTGQALCIVFAVVGIPVTILAFQSVGELISRGITVAITKTEKRCFKRDPTNVEAKCTAVTFALMLIMLLCGSAMQIYLEKWTFLVGFYYWLITFTTIGYGDYVTGKKQVFWGVVFFLIWCTLGLCVVSSVFNAIAFYISKRRPSRKVCSCFSGGREMEDTNRNLQENENRQGKKENESEMKENKMNGRDESHVIRNSVGKNKENTQYNSSTYV